MECRDSRRFEGRLLPSIFAFLWMAMLDWPECVAASERETISFNIHVRPILSDKCFACHGFDSTKRQAELRLDTSEGSRENHNGRAAIVGKDLAASEMWRRITTTDESELMPPAESHKTLSAKEKEIIRLWIEQGAIYQKHWAFEDLAKSELPLNETATHPIDAFIASRLAEHSLKLAPEAEKETLIRRVAFALIGLPPTVEEVELYLEDSSADAYEKMVDRYLASQRFGEEMARHWLDVARYADTHGMHLDNERQTWAYRDWVISAFNRNLPFDRFTIEQLAGDLLPEPTTDQIVATGFNRCNVTTSEGGSIDDELIYRYAVDRASTTMQTWLGLTGGCAVCHDHKFDPITQKEFYQFYAFFHSAADPAMDGNALLTQPVLKLQTEEFREQLKAMDSDIAVKQQQIAAEVMKVNYVDPASIAPPPLISATETVWMEDDFPPSGKVQASPGAPTQFVAASEGNQVLSGQRSLKRTDKGLAQDVWDQATIPLTISAEANIFANVWLDPANPPRSIMLQFFKGGWNHRAVWGDYNAIEWGAVNTNERVHMGELPALGQWVRLEFTVEKIGLATGDALTGFALTQFGGTVFWDRVGLKGLIDPTRDPTQSFLAWWKQAAGKDTLGLPADLQPIAKGGPDAHLEKAPAAELVTRLRVYYLQEVCSTTKPMFAGLIAELRSLQEKRKALDDSIPSTFVFKDLAMPRPSFVMMRGAYDKPGDKVEPSVPAILPPLTKATPDARATRLDLAKWLVAKENPLTSRVTVNRFWQQFFGVGLVKTSYDFGTQGDMPSHPELLDWLASYFQQSDWNVKDLVRQMVYSKTFRQHSQITPELHRLDPENRLYARAPRFRLDAEQIRDNALFTSGLINLQMGGKGVKPYQPDNIWEPVAFGGSNTQNYRRDNGPALYRRSIYNFMKRTAPPPFMVNFDAPNREQFCTKREKSNTPLQALQLMNDVQHIEAARAMAQRMLEQGGQTFEDRLAFAYRIVLSRPPTGREVHVLEKQLTANMQHYQRDVELAKKLIALGESRASDKVDPSELAAYTLIANTLLNLDETVTRN
ncbi:MAG: PSD1 and planctomycete cytochrome C domain-containing protein [Planctomycetota bacterium]|nr:PSD1 and planctomycete cytochrome C domain-containing protein [Planctomycetota bacterium]